jgi:hypothetical protein
MPEQASGPYFPLVGIRGASFAKHLGGEPIPTPILPAWAGPSGRELGRDRGWQYVCLGFPHDWFLPLFLAEQWQTEFFPLVPKIEAIEQWQYLVEQLAWGVRRFDWKTIAVQGYPHGIPADEEASIASRLESASKNVSKALGHDMDLLRKYDEGLFTLKARKLGGDDPQFRHSEDFRSVYWFGSDHTFTPTQAACVRVLWQAWENGTPEIGQATILEHPAVDSESSRLSDLFKGHPAWKTMIVTGTTAGTYRLAETPEDS